MNVEDIEPFDMVFNDTLLVTTITYSFKSIVIEGIPARGRSKEQILRQEYGTYFYEN